ncbi:MAG: ABC transporter ATP-binding protein [Kiritimatiellia bacterium]
MADEPIVFTKDLSKIFRDFWRRPRARAVDGINLTLHPGEVYGLLGPNGSGKSTTIKVLLGLLHPDGGEVRVLGKPPRDVAVKRRVGYLPEESYLYPYLDARETLRFYAALFGLQGAEREKRIDELLEMVGLSHTGRRRVGEFSKGMARRIGLAQALINDPDLVILDEPTSGLDPLGTRQVKDIVRALADRGKSVLLSSHLLADVEDVCDRITILYGGKVRASGPIRDLLQVANHLQIRLKDLEEDQRIRLLDLLEEQLGERPTLEPTRKDLESFFLEVVAQARRESGEGSGTRQEGELAEFLR